MEELSIGRTGHLTCPTSLQGLCAPKGLRCRRRCLVVPELGQHLSRLHTEVIMSGTCGHSPSNPTYGNQVKNDKTKQITNLDNNKCQIANLTQQTTTGTSAATGITHYRHHLEYYQSFLCICNVYVWQVLSLAKLKISILYLPPS